jgi:HD-like signal output (HDOD) protein/CheY-like chemotaxis protein
METRGSGTEEKVERVLIVDDDESVRVALERGLRRLGYDVIQAADGPEGLELAARSAPQVVLVDLRMPEMDGHTFLRRLTESGSAPSVVVVSGQGSIDDVVSVFRAGAVDYLKKPWSPSDLMNAVSRGIELYERRRGQARAAERGAPAAGAPPADGGHDQEKSPLGDILVRLRNGEIPLPAVPGVLKEIRGLIQRSSTDVDDVVSCIQRDQHLAADVLRISNSGYYARNGRNYDVKTAVSRIGFRQVQCIVETTFMRGLCNVRDPRARHLLNEVWRHSLAHALAMRALADLMAVGGRISPDTAYLVGLFCDAGASLLLWVAAERGLPPGTQEEVERSLIGMIREYHADVGASILTRWSFGPEIIEAVRGHHAEEPPQAASAYWAMSVVAGELADKILKKDDTTANERRSRQTLERCATEIGIGETLRVRLVDELRKEFGGLVQTM